MYLSTKKRIPGGYNPLESKNKYMLQKVHKEDDLYIFRDRNNRFIFTIDKDENENDVPILIDVITRAEVKSRLKSNNTILKI
jgi:hypothetical protein